AAIRLDAIAAIATKRGGLHLCLPSPIWHAIFPTYRFNTSDACSRVDASDDVDSEDAIRSDTGPTGFGS
ncbi:hypothetical protein, partial [Burkholderia pseudomallei]|uniref:hypothetical protein n=1 Tax=Burkholderia pseudomallei TaxID=28450 RepID=UPI001ED9C2AA